MKNIGKLAALGAVLAASSCLAFAVTIDSNSTTVIYAAGPVSPVPVPAFNLTTGLSPWTGPIGTSTWVGPELNTSPGGGVVAPAGMYTYTSTFLDTLSSTGTITVLADDTTNVLLNGNTIVGQAAPIAGAHCTVGTPNCVTATTYTLAAGDFIVGSNVLTFDVNQLFGFATGLDFEANITETPEPSSLMLLGSGLVAAAGMFFRRRQTV